MGYIDSHAHMCSEKFRDEFDELIIKFNEANIERFMLVCCEKSDLDLAIEHKKDYFNFDIAYGYHPCDIEKINDEDLVNLEEIIKSNHITTLGEIGLDYYWDKSNKEKQKDIFIMQIAIANKLNIPIIVHSRDAIQDTYDILKKYDKLNKGVIHCYSSSFDMAEKFIKLGYYISLAGPVTFKNAVVQKDVAKNIDLKYLLIETDSPYLTPHPKRGERNDCSNIVYIAQTIADIKEISVEKVMEATTSNYYDLFK